MVLSSTISTVSSILQAQQNRIINGYHQQEGNTGANGKEEQLHPT
jgi:hypothetical protein